MTSRSGSRQCIFGIASVSCYQNMASCVLKLVIAVTVLITIVTMRGSDAQAAYVSVVPGASEAACINATQAQLSVGVNCSSLGYALHLLGKYITATPIINVTVYYDHEFIEGEEGRIELSLPSSASGHTLNITGFNHTRRTVFCTSHNSGVAFVGFQSVAISYLKWEGCGAQHNTTAFYTWLPSFLFPIQAFSALFFYRCKVVYIDQSVFANSTHGSGVSIYDSSNILVQNCIFLENRISPDMMCNSTTQNGMCSPQASGLYIETTECGGFTNLNCSSSAMATHQGPVIIVSNCTFMNNENPGAYTTETKLAVPTSISDHWPFGKGAGFCLALRGYVVELHAMLTNCTFTGNHAIRGGGVEIKLHPKFSNVTLSLTHNMFLSNSASDSGGGLRLGVYYEQILEDGAVIPSIVNLTNCTFQTNTAKRWGGGTTIYSSSNSKLISSVDLLSCTWTDNEAYHSAPALGITSSQFGVSWTTTIFPTCHNCTFSNNRLTIVTRKSREYGYGAVFLQTVPMNFTGNTLFEENTETGLCISSTSVELHDTVTFRGNKGGNGGAMLLLGTSWINLGPNLTLLFENNTAFQDGGAIYYTFPPSLSLKDFKDCFIQYTNKSIPFHKWPVKVNFTGNNAFQNGDAVFVSNLQECTWSEAGNYTNPFNATNSNISHPFSYQNQLPQERAVSTPPVHIEFNLVIHEYLNKSWYWYSVMPGESFKLDINITDFFHTNTSSVVSAACHNVSSYLQYDFQRDLCKDGTYAIEGLPNSFGISHNVSLKNMNIRGPPNTEILLVLLTKNMQPVIVPILVQLTDCLNGFVLDNSELKTCVCFSTVSNTDNFLCIDSSGDTKPCVRNGYWYGNIGVKHNGAEVSGLHSCLYETCTTFCEPCAYLPVGEWCLLPPHESYICRGQREGPLCSQCKEGLTLTYDSFSCTKCSFGKSIGLWILFVVYWAFILLQLIAIVKLDFKVGSGYMYAFLYYFSVLKYVMWYNLPNGFTTGLLKIFGTLARLDPLIYEFSDLCLYPGATSIEYEAFHYLHPLIILTLVALLVLLGHYFPRFSIFSGNYAIQAICYVVLLAYTSLAETSLDILNPMSYDATNPHVNGKFVQIQPGTQYMDKTQHLPYAMLALAVEIAIILPFSIFMLFAPLLVRYVNLIKVKPILDEYQNCYKDKYRWFAGVYLVGRQLFFLTSVWTINFAVSDLLNQIFCVLILLLHAIVLPYRRRWLNYVDTFFLANLTLLTLLYSGSGVGALPWDSNARIAVVTIAIILPCLYFFILLAVGLAQCVKRRKRTKAPPLVNVVQTEEPGPDSFDDVPPRFLDEELEHRSRSLSRARSMMEKEPLLAGESKTQSWYNRLGARLSTRSRSHVDRDTQSTSSSPSST